MNSLENITGRITADARDYKELALTEAKRQAADITDTYKSEADYSTSQIRFKTESEIASRLSRVESNAKMKHRNRMLETKSQLVDECFAEAIVRINSLNSDEYITFLAGQLSQCLEDRDAVIVLNEKDRSAIGERLLEEAHKLADAKGFSSGISLSDEKASISGGFILIFGEMEVNCSTDALVAERKKELENKVLGILFK